MTKTTQGARRITLKGSLDGNRPLTDYGEWTESNDIEITGDPEYDRAAWGEGQEPLPTQFVQNDRELTRTFDLPRDRQLLKTLIAYTKRGGGYFEFSDQYLEPGSGAAFDLPVVSHGQLGGFVASGANVNEPNGKATVQITINTGGMPSA